MAMQLGDQILRLVELTVQLEAVTKERDELKQQRKDGDVPNPVR